MGNLRTETKTYFPLKVRRPVSKEIPDLSGAKQTNFILVSSFLQVFGINKKEKTLHHFWGIFWGCLDTK